ncbi:uncharacterized protein PFLUO_LOCUS423 [Penicillium psychrofluorescens]|uniref:uncharacterized protein n=1 Tax=Penicillium psychrofluorescens TaxID=3158075 RepID=UPI003CCDACF5
MQTYPTAPFRFYPRPRFCLLRPGGVMAPLIPMDELPSWLQVGLSPDMCVGLQPASLTFIPREGEYEVVCSHCSSSVDSMHLSFSERVSDVQSPPSAQSPPSVNSNKTCPGAFWGSPGYPPMEMLKQARALPVLGQPPFHATLQNPTIGMCIVPIQDPQWSLQGGGFPPGDFQPSAFHPGPAQSSGHASGIQSAGLASEIISAPAVYAEAGSVTSSHLSHEVVQSGVVPQVPGLVPDHRAAAVSSGPISTMASSAIANRVPTPGPNGTRSVTTQNGSLKSPNESIASTRSLTAAVERLKEVIGAKISRNASLCHDIKSETGQLSVHSSLKESGIIVAGANKKGGNRSTRARRRRRRRRHEKDKPKPATDPVEDKVQQEQPNSATKRRDRRERLQQKNANYSSRYWHMMMIPNWRSAVPQS